MDFSEINNGILKGLETWESKFIRLSEEIIENKLNNQNRTIKQILGHMVDSASNNTHRIIHLQYPSPFRFPDYAASGNNDRWIAIQDYQKEHWGNLIKLRKFSHLHLIHVINSIDHAELENEWISESESGNIKLKDMINDFLRLFNLHLSEIQEIIVK